MTEAINRTMVEKINELWHSIKLVEDCFGSLTWRSKGERKLRYGSDMSSYDYSSVVDGILDLPESIQSGEIPPERGLGVAKGR